MKKMSIKKILLAIACASAVFVFTPKTGVNRAFADEVTNDTAQEEIVENTQDNATEIEDVVTEEPSKKEVHTFGSRLKEWLGKYYVELTSTTTLAGVIGSVLALIAEIKKNKQNAQITTNAIAGAIDVTKENTDSNDKVLDVVNALIDKTNEFADGEIGRDAHMQELILLNKAVLEILVSVYANNKNIPQPIKDLVNYKYVNALKSVDEQEKNASVTGE